MNFEHQKDLGKRQILELMWANRAALFTFAGDSDMYRKNYVRLQLSRMTLAGDVPDEDLHELYSIYLFTQNH